MLNAGTDEQQNTTADVFYAKVKAERDRCPDFAKTGRHWFILNRPVLGIHGGRTIYGAPMLVCSTCGEKSVP